MSPEDTQPVAEKRIPLAWCSFALAVHSAPRPLVLVKSAKDSFCRAFDVLSVDVHYTAVLGNSVFCLGGCSAKIASTHDVAIEVGNRRKINDAPSRSKTQENTLTLFAIQFSAPKNWAALRRLFSFLENFCEQNSRVSLPDLQAINGASPPHLSCPLVFEYRCLLWGVTPCTDACRSSLSTNDL